MKRSVLVKRVRLMSGIEDLEKKNYFNVKNVEWFLQVKLNSKKFLESYRQKERGVRLQFVWSEIPVD